VGPQRDHDVALCCLQRQLVVVSHQILTFLRESINLIRSTRPAIAPPIEAVKGIGEQRSTASTTARWNRSRSACETSRENRTTRGFPNNSPERLKLNSKIT